MAIAKSSTKPLASRSRSRSRNKWLPLSPNEQQARAAAKGAPLLEPWREHNTLRGLRDRLQLAFDCWNLLDAPDGTSRRSVYLPPGVKEPDSSYRNRIENARPTGFFRDALPHTLQAVIGDVDGRGTDLGVFLFIADLLVLRDGGCRTINPMTAKQPDCQCGCQSLDGPVPAISLRLATEKSCLEMRKFVATFTLPINCWVY
ncbi:hypothetical protein [Cyanobium sp. ATX-6F1]|uniref:hypothetical protein n=1 Tax=Cyanobium sp. ATX-6F1 TaxID=3137388 RepID=UPI0039BE9902